ncbi:MAG: TolB family protein [Actinomycetota bacterium]
MTRSPRRTSFLVAMLSIGLVAGPAAPSMAAAPIKPPVQYRLISVTPDGEAAKPGSAYAVMSGNGDFVAFQSPATNLTTHGPYPSTLNHFVRDLRTGQTSDLLPWQDDYPVDISDGGRVVLLCGQSKGDLTPDDTNRYVDLYTVDRSTGAIQRVTAGDTGSGGGSGDSIWGCPYPGSAMSSDGRFVAFGSIAPLVADDTNGAWDTYVFDRATGTTERVSVTGAGQQAVGMTDGWGPAWISDDGRFVAFRSNAANLVPAGTTAAHIFVHDRATGTTKEADVASDGTAPEWGARSFTMSGDGRFVAFDNTSTVPQRDDAGGGVFLHDMIGGRTERVSVLSDGSALDWPNGTTQVFLSDDGRFVGFRFTGTLPNLSHFNGWLIRDRSLETTEWVDSSQWWVASYCCQITDDGRFSPITMGVSGQTQVALEDLGPPLGVTDVQARDEGGSISVTGHARATGAVLAHVSDPNDDGFSSGGMGASDLKAEITGARIISRPEEGDLLFAADHAEPGVLTCAAACLATGGYPGVTYQWDFEVGDTPYRIVATSGLKGCALVDGYFCVPVPPGWPIISPAGDNYPVPPPRTVVTLLTCDSVCTPVGTLSGGFGTTGGSVLVSVPTSMVGAAPGSRIGPVHVQTAVGQGAGDTTVLDLVDLPAVTFPNLHVVLGIAPHGTPVSAVAFDTPATLQGGTFSASMPTGSAAPGDDDVWVKACFGSLCANPVSTPVHVS